VVEVPDELPEEVKEEIRRAAGAFGVPFELVEHRFVEIVRDPEATVMFHHIFHALKRGWVMLAPLWQKTHPTPEQLRQCLYWWVRGPNLQQTVAHAGYRPASADHVWVAFGQSLTAHELDGAEWCPCVAPA
jgi:hypothetical protein